VISVTPTGAPPSQPEPAFQSVPITGGRRHLGTSGGHALAITTVGALLFATFSIFAPHFFTAENIYEMAKVSSYTFIVAVGLTYIFISAEIDLSIGANMSFAGVVMAIAVANHGINPWLAALFAVATGSLVGAVNGFVVTVVGVQSFIVTLGMLSVLGGAALVLTDGVPINYPQNLKTSLFTATNGTIGTFPVQILWAAGVFVMGVFLLRFTKFGYHIYAAGGNARAAREMGVNVKLTKFLCFVITGALCGLVAAMEAGWLLEADPGSGDTFTLQTIAAIIIGGVALYGGAGSVYGTFIGTAITGMLGTGLILLGLNSNWPELIEGTIIILVVTFQIGLQRLSGHQLGGTLTKPLRHLNSFRRKDPTIKTN
jgi:ribose transport system permease protein